MYRSFSVRTLKESGKHTRRALGSVFGSFLLIKLYYACRGPLPLQLTRGHVLRCSLRHSEQMSSIFLHAEKNYVLELSLNPLSAWRRHTACCSEHWMAVRKITRTMQNNCTALGLYSHQGKDERSSKLRLNNFRIKTGHPDVCCSQSAFLFTWCFPSLTGHFLHYKKKKKINR